MRKGKKVFKENNFCQMIQIEKNKSCVFLLNFQTFEKLNVHFIYARKANANR